MTIGRAHWLRLLATDLIVVVFFGATAPQCVRASLFTRSLDHTQRRTTFGRTPLDEWSARRRDLYLTTHNNHNKQTSMPPVGFEPTISAGERLQTHALDRAATGTGTTVVCFPSNQPNICDSFRWFHLEYWRRITRAAPGNRFFKL